MQAMPKYRVFCVAPVINAAPFDTSLIAGTLLVEGGEIDHTNLSRSIVFCREVLIVDLAVAWMMLQQRFS